MNCARRGASGLLEDALKAKDLPGGHYGIKEAQDRVDKEYEECKKIEEKYQKRLRYFKPLNETIANNIASHFLKSFSLPPTMSLVFNKQDGRMSRVAAGWYSFKNQTIYFPWDSTSIRVLIHEMAHHVCWRENLNQINHRNDFLWVEEMLFEAFFLLDIHLERW